MYVIDWLTTTMEYLVWVDQPKTQRFPKPSRPIPFVWQQFIHTLWKNPNSQILNALNLDVSIVVLEAIIISPFLKDFIKNIQTKRKKSSKKHLPVLTPSSHHGSMKNGCMSSGSYLSKTVIVHWTMIMRERAYSLKTNGLAPENGLFLPPKGKPDFLPSPPHLFRCKLAVSFRGGNS